ncbi:hypothetical protein RI367_005798 [Sorochytrium milnesiophthora]
MASSSSASNKLAAVLYQRDVERQVATITLNRPKSGNSLDSGAVQELARRLREAEDDPDVRVVVLTGSGKFFCTGMSLTALPSSSTPPHNASKTPATDNVFLALRKCAKPTIALLNGPALGGGVGLMLATDFRVACPSFYMSMPEVHLGLVPALISLVVVPELGLSRSRQLMLTGERVGADECLRIGALTTVYPTPEDMQQGVDKLVQTLCKGGPNAMAEVKQLVAVMAGAPSTGPTVDRSSSPDNIKEAFAKRLFSAIVASDEAAHGLQAFRERKPADWRRAKL